MTPQIVQWCTPYADDLTAKRQRQERRILALRTGPQTEMSAHVLDREEAALRLDRAVESAARVELDRMRAEARTQDVAVGGAG